MSHKVVALGEVLYDCFEGRSELGGAPTNFIGHVQAIGCRGAIVSAVGADQLGKDAVAELARRGVDTQAITTSQYPTGTVDVHLNNGQPSYTINEPVAWDEIIATDYATRLVQNANAICFGTLAQRRSTSKQSIQALLRNASEHSLIILDVNLRKPFVDSTTIAESVKLANAIKLNDEEVPVVAGVLDIPTDFDRFANCLHADFGIQLLFITCGADGAHLYRGDEKVHVPATRVEKMVSTVGAGDAFTAGAIAAFLSGQSLKDVGMAASKLASQTCAYHGGLPVFV